MSVTTEHIFRPICKIVEVQRKAENFNIWQLWGLGGAMCHKCCCKNRRDWKIYCNVVCQRKCNVMVRTHRGLWYSGTKCSINETVTHHLPPSCHSSWQSSSLRQGWSDVLSCEGVGISHTLYFCCPPQYIVQHSRRSKIWTTPWQSHKIFSLLISHLMFCHVFPETIFIPSSLLHI